MITKLSWGPCLIVLLTSPALADQVLLKNGGQLEAEIVERTSASLVLELDGGRLTLDANDIESIVPGPTAFGTYRERAQRLAPDDASGWLTLAQWARDRRLHGQAREAFARALLLDPENEEANRAMGNVLFDGRWMTREDAYRAQGYVLFEDRWMLPEERDGLIRERAAAAEAARIEGLRREADARLAEAEARARDAEARLREVERRVLEAAALAAASASSSCCDDSDHDDHRHHRRGHDEPRSRRAPHEPAPDGSRGARGSRHTR